MDSATNEKLAQARADYFGILRRATKRNPDKGLILWLKAHWFDLYAADLLLLIAGAEAQDEKEGGA